MIICKKFFEQNVKYNDFATSFGISENNLNNWIRKYNNFGESALNNSKKWVKKIIEDFQKKNWRAKIRDEMFADLRRMD